MRARVSVITLILFCFAVAGCSATIPVTSQAEIDAINESSRRHTAFVKTREQAKRQKTNEFSLDAHTAEWVNEDGDSQRIALTNLTQVHFRDHETGFATGLAAGVLAGSAVGALFGGAMGSGDALLDRDHAASIGAVVLGGVCGVVGGLLGGVHGDQRTYAFPASASAALVRDPEGEDEN